MNRPTKFICQLLVAELAALGLFVFLVYVIQPSWVASAAVGGLVFVLPSTYSGLYALSSMGDYRERRLLTVFYRGQSGKWVLTAAGFAVAFKFVQPLHSLVMLMAFCGLMLTHLIIAARLSPTLDSVTAKNDTNLD